MWFQKELLLKPRPRGFHLITDEIILGVSQLKNFKVGIANIFIKHTSASLSINENASPDVRRDLETHFNKYVPENASYYEHRFEGSDDMPAHIKSSILGASLNIPIKEGQLNLGTWQGIYLCEHRNQGGSRKIVVTISGEIYE